MQWFPILIDYIIRLLSRKPSKKKPIDWSNPKAKISKYFTVGEATYLPSWKAYHQPTEEEKACILKLAATMDKVRELLKRPIIVNVWIRPKFANISGHPKNGQNYNKFIGGASKSAHKLGRAVDFHVKGMDCRTARGLLISKLKELDIRLENIDGPWLHIDNMPVKFNRFFKP